MELYQALQNFTTENRADLTKDLFLVGDVRTVGLCVLAYLYMCIQGPRVMQSRKEIHVKPVMQIYNIFMIIANAYICEEILATISGCNWLCEVGDFSITPRNTRHARALWYYYLTKIIEFLDSFFFIARKKFSQLSFLHVYHHASMAIVIWTIVTFMPAGDAFTAIFVNSVIHVIMYSYYFFAALGPEYQKYLWWKKHLTKLQIIQFFWIMHHGASALYINCNPRHSFIYYFLVAYMFSFVVLFTHFYIRSYLRNYTGSSKKSKTHVAESSSEQPIQDRKQE